MYEEVVTPAVRVLKHLPADQQILGLLSGGRKSLILEKAPDKTRSSSADTSKIAVSQLPDGSANVLLSDAIRRIPVSVLRGRLSQFQ